MEPSIVVGIDLVRHEISKTLRNRVELVLERLIASRLAVLQERDHEEGDDTRCRIGDELPRVRIMVDRTEHGPDDNQQCRNYEGHRVAGDMRAPGRKF